MFSSGASDDYKKQKEEEYIRELDIEIKELQLKKLQNEYKDTQQPILKFKKLTPDAKIPSYQTEGSAGFDFHSASKEDIVIKPHQTQAIPTGLVCSFSSDFEIQIRSRSGLALKNNIAVLNAPGTIDSDYRGEIKVILHNHGPEDFIVKYNDRIAQGVFAPVKQPVIQEVSDVEETSRGTGGFGSTGV
jgi:dUTP pyrophosphatase